MTKYTVFKGKCIQVGIDFENDEITVRYRTSGKPEDYNPMIHADLLTKEITVTIEREVEETEGK